MKYETLKRRGVDTYCLQEVKWKRERAKIIGNGFKFFGVGVVKQKTVWV